MNIKKYAVLLIATTFSVLVHADDAVPGASPSMTLTANDSVQVTDSYEGSAPVKASFKANPSNLDGYTPIYEWRFYESTDTETPFLTRYEENTDYTFNESGSFTIQLFISFVNGTDTVEYSQESPFTISISTSKLEIPNAFSPNNDGQNDVFKVKEGHQSIVSFHGYIFNRWGNKIFDWTDINDGWDGTINGHDAKEGVYFVIIKAKGADGRNYNLRRDINLLRGYDTSESAN